MNLNKNKNNKTTAEYRKKRRNITDKIDTLLDNAQKEYQIPMFKAALKAGPTHIKDQLLSLVGKLDEKEKVPFKNKMLKYYSGPKTDFNATIKKQYQAAHAKLFELERRHNYPILTEYAKNIDSIKWSIPPDNRKAAVYPASGLDFIWGRVTDGNISMADTAYGEGERKNSWWDKTLINSDTIQSILGAYTKADFVNPDNIKLNKVQAEQWLAEYNTEDTTLVIKQLSNIRPLFDNNIKPKFGAIIMTDVPEYSQETIREMGYEKIHQTEFDKRHVPFARPLNKVSVFADKGK